ncbi:MAG TPA: hypothetical protein VFV38_33840 [Ktedonobacteraceae bacterium]|nr:hypothetical protein [Ktedonobacteraceae bacterium]
MHTCGYSPCRVDWLHQMRDTFLEVVEEVIDPAADADYWRKTRADLAGGITLPPGRGHE